MLRRAGEPYLGCLDPMTGSVIRSSRSTAVSYERDRPGELVHVDVKKLGKIPDGGGWSVHGRAATAADKNKRVRIDHDYVHSMVDDPSRLAYCEIHDDETAVTCAGFLTRAAAYFADHGVTRIERVMTDNAFAYRHGRAFLEAVAALGAVQKFIRPHCLGRTARPKGSTALCRPNGPTGTRSPPARPAGGSLRPGCSPTTPRGDRAGDAGLRDTLGQDRVYRLGRILASEDFSVVPDASDTPYTCGGCGAFMLDMEAVPNHKPRFASAIQPVLRTGT